MNAEPTESLQRIEPKTIEVVGKQLRDEKTTRHDRCLLLSDYNFNP